MTYEEALNEINQECVYCRTSNNCAKDECIWFLCKKAIDKQIPKKPVKLESWLSWTLWGCPSCGCMVDHDMTHADHHCQCGQHLDWSEVD